MGDETARSAVLYTLLGNVNLSGHTAMKNVFGLISLLISLLLVGVLAKKQLNPVAKPAISLPDAAGVLQSNAAPSANPVQPSAAIPEQVKQAVEAALQQARAVPVDP
jgi:type IV secretory pathway TrbF-like protein